MAAPESRRLIAAIYAAGSSSPEVFLERFDDMIARLEKRDTPELIEIDLDSSLLEDHEVIIQRFAGTTDA